MRKLYPFLLTISLILPSVVHGQIITSICGDSTAGYNGDNIAADTAQLHFPQSIVVDASGNVFIGDIGNNRIHKISNGIITTYAGTGSPGYSGDDGPATAANVDAAYMAVDGDGNLYVSDPLYNRVRKINTAGKITSIAGTSTAGFSGDGGAATAAALNQPAGIAADNAGNIYIADNGNGRIRKINGAGTISTIGGGGSAASSGIPATDAVIFQPDNITADGAGNIYFTTGNQVRKIDGAGIITTIAGSTTTGTYGDNAPATNALLNQPEGLATDASGNLYVSDAFNNRIRKINSSGIITTVAGTRNAAFGGDGGPATAALLSAPVGIAIDKAGSLYIADYGNNRIRYVRSTTAVTKVNTVDDHFTIYPNPSSGTFTAYLPAALKQAARITVMNMAGTKVKELIVPGNIPAQRFTIMLDAPPGVYLLVLTTGSERWCRQLTVSN
jgi:trimeric autotransporter adhesin